MRLIRLTSNHRCAKTQPVPTDTNEPDGGVDCPWSLSPQHSTDPSVFTPQVCPVPVLTEVKEPQQWRLCSPDLRPRESLNPSIQPIRQPSHRKYALLTEPARLLELKDRPCWQVWIDHLKRRNHFCPSGTSTALLHLKSVHRSSPCQPPASDGVE